MLIRPATSADIPAITRIYAHAVEHGTASFELTPPDEAEMARRMRRSRRQRVSLFRRRDRRRVAGHAYAALYRARPAYRFTVEDLVYVAPDMHARRRPGAADELIETAAQRAASGR